MVLLAAVGLESADTFVGSGSRNVIPISNPGGDVKLEGLNCKSSAKNEGNV